MLELEEAHGGTAKKNMMMRLMLTRLRYAVFPLGSPSVSFRATRLYPPATCPLPSQSHSDSLTVPGSSAARLPQDMPNGLKVRDHDWRSASSRDSAGMHGTVAERMPAEKRQSLLTQMKAPG